MKGTVVRSESPPRGRGSFYFFVKKTIPAEGNSERSCFKAVSPPRAPGGNS